MDAARLLTGLGRRVRAQRARLGYTLHELAGRAGLSSRFLIQIEAGTAHLVMRTRIA